MTIYKLKKDEHSSHSKIIAIVRKQKKNLKILDVGCADGFLASIFSDMGHEVHGIEGVEEDAQKAKKHCKEVMVINLDDLDKATLKYKPEEFDLMVFGSIFEHTKNPGKVLKTLVPYLKKDGKIIAAISNIANIYIRLQLLMGKWDYTERGLLDRTHIKFFTLFTATKMIEDAGLKIRRIDTTPIPLPMVFRSTAKGKPLNFVQQINAFLARHFRKLLGYIFVIEAGWS